MTIILVIKSLRIDHPSRFIQIDNRRLCYDKLILVVVVIFIYAL